MKPEERSRLVVLTIGALLVIAEHPFIGVLLILAAFVIFQ